MAYAQVSLYGMSEALGAISFSFAKKEPDSMLDKPYSESTSRLIDDVWFPPPFLANFKHDQRLASGGAQTDSTGLSTYLRPSPRKAVSAGGE